MTRTTKGPIAPTIEPFNASGCSRSQQFQTPQEITTGVTIMSDPKFTFEPIDRDSLPELAQRVRGATFVSSSVEAAPEGEPAGISEDGAPTPRPFQVGDEVLVDGEPGVIAEMRDEAVRVDSTHALVEMTGFPFPAWDAVALTLDRTRPVDGRQIELVRPASTDRASSQAGLASIRHGVVRPDAPDGEPSDYAGDVDEREVSRVVSDVKEFACPVDGCGYVAGAIGPVRPGKVAELAAIAFEHRVSHPVSGTPRDVGEWNTIAGDVIVFRGPDGVLHADVLADSSVKEPAHLRRLAEALNAAAVAWEAVL